LALVRKRRVLRTLGWCYVAYHFLLAGVFVVSEIYDTVPGYWRSTVFELETLFVVLVYPAIIPALMVCGGLHDRCTSVLGHAAQVAVFAGAVACYLLGWWVLTSALARRIRPSTGAAR
jgi:hypothetical protein